MGAPSVDVAATMILNDEKSRSTTIKVPAKSAVYLLDQIVKTGNTVTGKVLFTPSANMTIKHFVARKTNNGYGTWTKEKDLYDIEPRLTVSTSGLTTGLFSTDTRTAEVDTDQTVKFYQGALPWNTAVVNRNEYEDGTNLIESNTPQVNTGNYGVTYEYKFKSTTGKTLRIHPLWYSSNGSQFVYWTPQQGWQKTEKLSPNGKTDQSHEFKLAANEQVMRVILPGGNNAQMKFEFIADKSCPTLAVTPEKNTNSNRYDVKIKITANDPTGVEKLETVANSSRSFPTSGFYTQLNASSGKHVVSKSGTWYVHVRATDKNGNVTTKTSGPFVKK